MNDIERPLDFLLSEYDSLVAESLNQANGEVDWARLRRELVHSADWTDAAATHLIRLVRDNGSFVLRNALALAIASGMEDGDLDF